MSDVTSTKPTCPTCGAAIPAAAEWESLGIDANHGIERAIVTCCPVPQMVLRRLVDGEWRVLWRPVLGGRVRQAFACTREDMQRGGWKP